MAASAPNPNGPQSAASSEVKERPVMATTQPVHNLVCVGGSNAGRVMPEAGPEMKLPVRREISNADLDECLVTSIGASSDYHLETYVADCFTFYGGKRVWFWRHKELDPIDALKLLISSYQASIEK